MKFSTARIVSDTARWSDRTGLAQRLPTEALPSPVTAWCSRRPSCATVTCRIFATWRAYSSAGVPSRCAVRAPPTGAPAATTDSPSASIRPGGGTAARAARGAAARSRCPRRRGPLDPRTTRSRRPPIRWPRRPSTLRPTNPPRRRRRHRPRAGPRTSTRRRRPASESPSTEVGGRRRAPPAPSACAPVARFWARDVGTVGVTGVGP